MKYLLTALILLIAPLAYSATVPFDQSTALVNMSVTESGIHRVTHAQLLGLGVDLAGIPANSLQILHNGDSVPRTVQGQNSGDTTLFGPGGYIEFIGKKDVTFYSLQNHYVLVIGAPQASIEQDNSTPLSNALSTKHTMETVVEEPQIGFSFNSPLPDPWYAAILIANNGPTSTTQTISTPYRLTTVSGASLNVDLGGISSWPQQDDQHVVVSLNGSEIADVVFDGRTAATASGSIPNGVLLNGNNTVKVTVPMDTGVAFEFVLVDKYSIEYPRNIVAVADRVSFTGQANGFRAVNFTTDQNIVAYREYNDGSLKRLTNVQTQPSGATFLTRVAGDSAEATYYLTTAASALNPSLSIAQAAADITSGEADYIVIAHPDFIGAQLNRLIQYRETEGYTTKVVNVFDIYAQFGFAQVGADPIHAYVKHAYDNMGLKYLLIVGSDNYDYHNNLNTGAISFVPTRYVSTGKLNNFMSTDSLYGDIDDDNIADIAVGRLPVRGGQELANLINKTVLYELGTTGKRALFAADSEDIGAAYKFHRDSTQTINLLPPDWAVERADIDGPAGIGLANAKSKLVSTINKGAAVTAYFGHSFSGGWGQNNILTSSTVDGLSNPADPTVVMQFGCWNTYFVDPRIEALPYHFLTRNQSGAAAVIGSTGLTDASQETVYAKLLVNRAMGQTGQRKTLGDAMIEAKAVFARTYPNALHVLHGQSLLGDPALSIPSAPTRLGTY